jgi:hypothetical protein
MKATLVALVMLLTQLPSFSQSTSTAEVETAINQFIVEYNKAPYDFFKNRCTPDFRYTDGDGSFTLLPTILKNSKGRPSTKSSISNLKTFRKGDLGVVSGIHSFDGERKVAFTYTLEKRTVAGSAPKWMFAASQHTPVKKESVK